MMNIKALTLGLMTGAMILGASMTASAAFSFEFTNTQSTSETTTVSDSHGNEYSVTHTIETVNGETTEWFENAPLEVFNNADCDITGLYIADSEDDTWGDNWLVIDGEECTFEQGCSIWGTTITYNPAETMLDVHVDLADGTYVEFTNCKLDNLEDGMHVTMDITANDEGNYTLFLR